jgi:hypothetical protein
MYLLCANIKICGRGAIKTLHKLCYKTVLTRVVNGANKINRVVKFDLNTETDQVSSIE